MLPRLRRWWLTAHRWMALSLGWMHILSGLTGAILVVAQPMHQWARPDLFKAHTEPGPGEQSAPLQPILKKLRHQFGPQVAFAFNPPRKASHSLHVGVQGPWRGKGYINPYMGNEKGQL